MDRESHSNIACPKCGFTRFDSVMTGPAPDAATHIGQGFRRAVADGIVVHERQSDAVAGHHWRCASCRHEFGDGEGRHVQAGAPTRP